MKKKIYLSLVLAFSFVILLAVICVASRGRQKSEGKNTRDDTFAAQDDSVNDSSAEEEKQTAQTGDGMHDVSPGDSETAWNTDEQSDQEQSGEEVRKGQEKQETQEAIKEQENEDHAKPQPNTETGWGPIA